MIGNTSGQKMTNSQFDDQDFMLSREFKSLETKWCNSSNDVEAGWSMLYNLNDYDGKRSCQFETLCRKDIELFIAVRGYYIRNHQKIMPTVCNGYHRLAMLYDKRKDYVTAYNICREAISNGAIDESGKPKGTMIRCVRYAKKAGIELPK